VITETFCNLVVLPWAQFGGDTGGRVRPQQLYPTTTFFVTPQLRIS